MNSLLADIQQWVTNAEAVWPRRVSPGLFFLSVVLQGVARSLDAQPISLCASGHAGAFFLRPVIICMLGGKAVYRLSVSLPNFPLEKYERAVAGIGETDVERAQKFRIGRSIFRGALMEYWNVSCPLSGIASPHLL